MVATSIVATLFTLSIIITASVAPAAASTTSNNTTTTTTTDTMATKPSSSLPSSGLELSAKPVWDERVWTTSITPINQTHNMVAFEGNGTMTAPDTGETVNMTNNGTAIGSLVPQANNTVISYGRENVFSVDDGDTSAITFFEIVQYDPVTFQGRGLATAVFDNNATGSLAPFNGMLVVGTHEEDPTTQTVTIRLWEWRSGVPIPPVTTDMGESPTSPTMNTTTATTTIDSMNANVTGTSAGQRQ